MAAKTNLVIVESSAKARTLERFLGNSYVVRACLGHVRDLPKSKLGVDPARDFAPNYVVPPDRKDIVKRLKEQARQCESIYLATDPDREGEAIAWHLVDAMELDGSGLRTQRIEFHEVTKNAVLQALAHPRQIDMQRVDAQQARRVLDRLVGYKISPLLWKKVRRGLSAGRVQSVAVRLVVDREREIRAFQQVEFWTLEAELAKLGQNGQASTAHRPFMAKLLERDGQKIELPSQVEATSAQRDLESAAYRVREVREREQVRNPAAPFTTSTLQQEASRKLRFTAKRTMAVAQQLYEGLELGQGDDTGLITYMRTDSTNVAESAIAEAREYIRQRLGADQLPRAGRVYKTKSRLAQEAHEAIRPTSAFRTPQALEGRLSRDQHRLYELVWKRFVASQMASAVSDITTAEIEASGPDGPTYHFRATGSRLRVAGFLSLYLEGRDDDDSEDDEKQLPPLRESEALELLRLLPEQHFTQPPPRYTEATLVKALEERGIGRPSTYAPILSTIQDRGYVVSEDRRLTPTELGALVTDLLIEHFSEIMDVDFTAGLEERLDEIAQGLTQWVPVVRAFYEPLEREVQVAAETMKRQKPPEELTDELCEKCGRQMAIKDGRYGRFLACTGFPECRNAKPLMTRLGVSCPSCGGELVERRSKKGRLFYGCSNYPSCEWISWYRPAPEPCPRCSGLQVQVGRDTLRCLSCQPMQAGPSRAPETSRRAAAPRSSPAKRGASRRAASTQRRRRAAASARGGKRPT